MTTQVDVISRGPRKVRIYREFLVPDKNEKNKVIGQKWVRKPAEFKPGEQPVGVGYMAHVHATERLVVEEVAD